MRKCILWITAILLFCTGAFGCKKTEPQSVAPSVPPTQEAVTPTDAHDAAATEPAAPSDQPTDAPDETAGLDPSYREQYVTFPSRGVQVHATIVLPGHTTVADAPEASPEPMTSPETSIEPTTSPEISGAPEASPEPMTSPETSIEPTTSPEISGAPEASPVAIGSTESGYPLVVFLHGHGGERNENGGFTEIARRLAAQGIVSVRLDFAGSGESEEAFTENSITSMKTDVLAALDFVKSTYPIDQKRVGVFGFDMGGRVALQVMAEKLYDFSAAVLLAPANKNDDWITLFGGQTEWERYKADAEMNNHTTFTTLFGQVQDLSIRWFSDLEMTDDPASTVGQTLAGRVLVIYAGNDTTVAPETSQSVAKTLGARTVELDTGGHSYGFYAENGDILTRIADETARFFAETLTTAPRAE